MFDQLMESSSSRKRERRWRYFTATAVLWTAAVSLVIAGGVVAHDGRLGDIAEITHIGLPLLPQKRGGDSHRAPTKQKAVGAAVQEPKKMIAQTQSPDEVQEYPTEPPVVPASTDSGDGAVGGSPNSGGGTKDGVEGGSETQPVRLDRTGPAQPQPEKKREEPPPQPEIVRKSGGVLQGSAIKRVSPVYPHIAKISRTMGAVVVEVVVAESGNVVSARALSGHPLLREAAVAAARQWKWSPTLLSSVPVQVVGTITFNFAL